MNIIKLIRNNALFKNFDDKEVNAIFDCLKGRILKCSRGKIVAAEDSPAEEIGIVLEGTLLKFVTKSDGSREAQGTLKEGEMFGEIAGYAGDKLFHYSVVAAEDVTILFITVETIVRQCSKNCAYHQKLLENTLSYMADKINTINKDTEYLIIKSMPMKIAKLIYDKYLMQGTTNVALGINRNEMAEYLNVSRPSMSREMIRMREAGIIEFRKDKIAIKDVDALADVANGVKRY